MNSPIPFLEGQRLYLRALADKDADGDYPAWLNDAEVCRGNSHHVFPYSREAALDYIRQTRQSTTSLVLAIVVREDHHHIGNIALQSIHPIHRSAEFAILIGDKTGWGKGYGLEAGRLLCRHGFAALNLHRIYCGTFADNAGMIGLAHALGMKEEGRRRQAAFKDGKYIDIVEFGLLETDFQ
ncbi:MAG: GNAT family N-acetyltransferase [Betaproteobacteria bacterium]|nr:GNAT family N-acetyltransferase [Betaproteobacteria bacterium]